MLKKLFIARYQLSRAVEGVVRDVCWQKFDLQNATCRSYSQHDLLIGKDQEDDR